MSLFENKAVKAVRDALAAAGSAAEIVKLAKASGSAAETAKAVDAEVGAVVTGGIFMVGAQPVLALVAGDRECRMESLGRALNLKGEVRAPEGSEIRSMTGFSAGGVAPVGSKTPLPTVIDVSLKRFETLYAAAGNAQHVFATSFAELKKLTGGIISYAVTEGDPPRRPV